MKQAGAAAEHRLFGLGLEEIYGRTNSSNSQSYLTDALGSVLSLRNPDQSAQADYTYGAYGETTETPPGASSNLIKYTGREQDTAGLYYYWSRYCSPVTDRFLSEDPIGLAGGGNLYTYVNGNPLSYNDPTGLHVAVAPPPPPVGGSSWSSGGGRNIVDPFGLGVWTKGLGGTAANSSECKGPKCYRQEITSTTAHEAGQSHECE